MKIELAGSAYEARSIIASCQRCVNLYVEGIDPEQGEPHPTTHYPTPGLKLLATSPSSASIRGLYKASNGDLYCVAGFTLYYITPTWTFTFIGTLNTTNVINPVSFSDNGTYLLLCDGTTNGYTVVMKTRDTFSTIGQSTGKPPVALVTSAAQTAVGTELVFANTIGVDAGDIVSGTGIVSGTTVAAVGATTVVLSAATTAIVTTGTTVSFYFNQSGWYGSTFVDFSDTYFVANYPGTPTFYVSNSESVTFDPLQFAGKSSKPDALVAAVVCHRVIWLIGLYSTEIWYDSGGSSVTSNFPFELMQGIAIDWGCVAPYSIGRAITALFWLSQNMNGEAVVLTGQGYNVKRISTYALENTFSKYKVISDAIAYCYQQGGHTFYVLNFPTEDATWVYDVGVGKWHERCWSDTDGKEHRHRATYHAFAYDTNVVGDWENGNIYAFDLDTFTDNGAPIKRLRSFPQQIDNDNNNKLMFKSFTADINVGTSPNPSDTPLITLRWSDTKGADWNNPINQEIGNTGNYLSHVNWNRLGLSRDRVFELSWANDSFIALNGAYVEVIKTGS